jgi:excisionase family DNA binding protein
LLNTAEAARFLRVSQASIRRWHDAGLLPGHRVGRRRERRFTEADLLAFMVRSAPPPASSPTAHIAGVAVAVSTHLATLYSSDAGGLRLTVPFLADGVRLRQPCFLVGSAGAIQRYASELDLKKEVQVVHFNGRAADDAIAQWEESFASALAKGPNMLRVVGEMAEERPMFKSEDEMFRYEQAYDVMCKRYPVVTICQYDVRQFDGVGLLRALKAHPDLFRFMSGALLN